MAPAHPRSDLPLPWARWVYAQESEEKYRETHTYTHLHRACMRVSLRRWYGKRWRTYILVVKIYLKSSQICTSLSLTPSMITAIHAQATGMSSAPPGHTSYWLDIQAQITHHTRAAQTCLICVEFLSIDSNRSPSFGSPNISCSFVIALNIVLSACDIYVFGLITKLKDR